MSNKYCNLPGADKISETFGRINEGFSLVEEDKNNLQSQINDHNNSNSAHNAQDITFESLRPTLSGADDTKEAIEKVDQRVDELVNSPDPNKDLELVDLRNSNIYGVFPTAKARLDYTDNLFSSQLAGIAKGELNLATIDGYVGNANYSDANGNWFEDEACTIPANDDTLAIQTAIDTHIKTYQETHGVADGAYNFYIKQTHRKLYLPGNPMVTQTIDLSFRNDLQIECGGIMRWNGDLDGTMIELKCSARTTISRLSLDLNNKAGCGIHHAGNGTSDGVATKDRLTGKGNVSKCKYYNVEMINQYSESVKVVLDLIPYPSDTTITSYYSTDDCEFYALSFRTGVGSGFMLALHGSTNNFFSPYFTCPNGIKIYGGSVSLYSPMFSMQGSDGLPIYAVKNGTPNVQIYDGYCEGSISPLFSFDPTSTAGQCYLKINGGTYSQLIGSTDFINIPEPVKGLISIESPRFSSKSGSKVGKINAEGSNVKYSTTTLSLAYEMQPDIEINANNYSVEFVTPIGVYRYDKPMETIVKVNNTKETNSASGIFNTIDEALLRVSNIYNGVVKVILETNSEITKEITINTPEVLIESFSNSVLTFSNIVKVPNYLEFATITINQTIDIPLTPKGGEIVIRSCTIDGGVGNSLINADGGNFSVNNTTVNSGSVAKTSTAGNKRFEGLLMSNTYNSSDYVISGNTYSKEIYAITSTTPPSTGSWIKGTKARNINAAAGQVHEWIITTSGDNNTWKAISTISA